VQEFHNSISDRIIIAPHALLIYGNGQIAVNIRRQNANSGAGEITLPAVTGSLLSCADMTSAGGIGTVTVNNGASNADNSSGVLTVVASTGGLLQLVKTSGTTGFSIRAGDGSQTSATTGTHGAVPAQVAGYYTVTIDGASQKIPYYNV
jgi:hypothetical protein